VIATLHLAGIAHELDALERAVMEEGGMTGEDYLKFAAEESSNVANDGMFSIQVIKGLGVVAGVSVTRWCVCVTRGPKEKLLAFLWARLKRSSLGQNPT
jgi:hypothetical protein